MAVIIQNISAHDDMVGRNDYVVRINNQTIAYFDHVRSEGLATCLRKAADAVDAAEADAEESRKGLAAALSESRA